MTVVPDDAAEVRRVTLTNRGATPRELELTSYAEIVLAPPEADQSHPAFSNLFVQTEWVPAHSAIVASRRPRSSADRTAWGVHVVAVGRELIGPVTCETDRARFIGRNRTVRSPAALDDAANGVLSGTAGAVLDPVFSLRARVRVAAGQSVRVAFTTLVAADRERATELSDRYNDPYSAQRALDLSWMQAQVELRELGIYPPTQRSIRRSPGICSTRRLLCVRHSASCAGTGRAGRALGSRALGRQSHSAGDR